jgi:hypothetical protein
MLEELPALQNRDSVPTSYNAPSPASGIEIKVVRDDMHPKKHLLIRIAEDIHDQDVDIGQDSDELETTLEN